MTTVVFVHGTGVRKDAYQASFDTVSDALKGRCDLVECYWGHLGSSLRSGGASIPDYDTARSLGDAESARPSDQDYLVALWGLLRDDPLCELRILALRGGDTLRELAPGQLSPGAELARLGRQFQINPKLAALLAAGGIAAEFDGARRAVMESAACADSLQRAGPALADYRAAMARAFIAEAAARVRRRGGQAAIELDAPLCDELERALVESLGGAERSIGGWIKDKAWGLVCRVGTPYFERRRGALTDAAYPGAGDILLYQARGQEIGQFIRDRIAGVRGPCVVLAHSLGGIACVDLLVRELPEISLLVTVGSQAPFLYEINALQSLPHGTPLPAKFPKWLNIYDKRDFLSYLGAGVFPGRVTDVEVDNRQSFPASHSAYWSNDDVWDAIFKELP